MPESLVFSRAKILFLVSLLFVAVKDHSLLKLPFNTHTVNVHTYAQTIIHIDNTLQTYWSCFSLSEDPAVHTIRCKESESSLAISSIGIRSI